MKSPPRSGGTGGGKGRSPTQLATYNPPVALNGEPTVLRKLLRCLALSLLVTTSGCALASPQAQAREASVSLGNATKLFCSGVAVKPHVVMTATHCIEQAGKTIVLNGVEQPLVILASDKTDHSLIRIQQKIRPVHFGPTPVAGDVAFIWGMPSGLPYLFRTGYYSGTVFDAVTGETLAMYDLNIWGGDSGSGIFNRKGQLIGTTIAMHGRHIAANGTLYSWKMAVSRPYSFTDKQWKEVR